MNLHPRDVFAPAPFDGKRFENPSGRHQHGLIAVARWMATRQRGVWPKHVAKDAAPRPLARVTDGTIRATLIGHSAVLLQVAGLNIVTDPMLSDWAGPLRGLGVKRLRPPALQFDDLPKIDVVLLSHNHYDHLDRPTLKRLDKRDRPLVLMGLKVARGVPCANVVELDWWESHALTGDVRATFVPAEHFSARGPFDRNETLWGGFVLETPAGTIYFAGDTGDGKHFAAIRSRFGPMTLSLLPIGAYEPRWFMRPVHIDPAQAVAASLTLQSKLSLAIHFGTFRLADDGFEAPITELEDALEVSRAKEFAPDFRVPTHGEPIIIQSR